MSRCGIEHFIERAELEHGCRRAFAARCGSDRGRPNGRADVFELWVESGIRAAGGLIGCQGKPAIDIRSEQIPARRSGCGWKQVEPQPGCADGVGLLHDQAPPQVEVGGGHVEPEGQQEPEEPERGGIDRTRPDHPFVWNLGDVPLGQSMAADGSQHHRQEDR